MDAQAARSERIEAVRWMAAVTETAGLAEAPSLAEAPGLAEAAWLAKAALAETAWLAEPRLAEAALAKAALLPKTASLCELTAERIGRHGIEGAGAGPEIRVIVETGIERALVAKRSCRTKTAGRSESAS